MRREIFFLDDPEQHVNFRWEAIRRLSGPKLAGARHPETLLGLFREQLLLTIAGYSRGDDLSALKLWYSKAIAFLAPYRASGGPDLDLKDPETYHYVLWTLSLGLLFGIDDAGMQQLTAHLNVHGQDALCDHLIKLVQPDLTPTQDLIFPRPYAALVQAISGEGQTVPAIQQFLQQYYDALASLSWHDSHLKQAPQFFGYWSFELAALVKAFHISDRAFADNMFYPRDLVHQRLFRTWLDNAQGDRDRSEMKSVLEEEDLQASVELLGNYFKQHLGGKKGELPQTLDVLSKLSSVPNSELEENPELMQKVIVQIMKSVLGASSGLNKVLEGQEDNAQLQEFISTLKAKEKEWQVGELDENAILSELSPEAKAAFEGKTGEVPSEQLKAHYGKISDKLSEVLESEQVDQLTFLEGLERLASDFGFALGKDPRPIAQEVADKVTADLREQRKGRNLNDFDWSSLFEKKNGDES